MYCLMIRDLKNLKEVNNHTAITLGFIVKLRTVIKVTSKLAEKTIIIDNYEE